MALTVFETAEQRLPCHFEQGDGGKVVVATERAVLLRETDHGGDDDRPERDDIWNMIQVQRPAAAPARQAPYVHPLVRRSSSLLSQKSLEICTESLGSETGSDGFSDADGATDHSCPGSDDDCEEGADEVAVRARAPRAFPPPLPSLARRPVGALQMRQHRGHGRLVVKAVPVPSSTLFRAQRRGGRLLLFFADTAAPASDDEKNHGQEPEQQADEQTHEEDDDEEVEFVDRGTVVEVKVSTQPQARGGGGSGARVHRSALVINKFVGAKPAVAIATCEMTDTAPAPQHPPKPPRSPAGFTTTAAAVLAAASALGATAMPGATPGDSTVLMTARRRRSKEELLNHMRRCGQLSGQLFIWEPCIATCEMTDTAPAPQHPPKPPRSPAGFTTTAAAVLAAVSALGATAMPPGGDGTGATPGDSKVLMTARRQRSKEELLNHMRRCGQLGGQVFIWGPCIATSS